jgi:cobalamin biosynthesis Mg chelatase CobN
MKKSTTIVVGVLVGIVFLGGAMFAQNIENTGPNSTNSVTQNNNTECTSENNNNVDVNSENNQSSDSGETGSTGNTNGGTSSTGNASNNNSNSTNVNINNENNCIAAKTTGGKGGGKDETEEGKATGVTKTPVGGVAAGNLEITQAIIAVAIVTGSFGAIFVGTKKLASTIS